MLDVDLICRLYIDFLKEDVYKVYIYEQGDIVEEYIEIYFELYCFLVSSEIFVFMVEDYFLFWSDDKSLVVGVMKKIIKVFLVEGDFLDGYCLQDEIIKEFGESLLCKV